MSIPTRHIMSKYFLAELFFSKEFAQALTINAAMKPLILLHGARQLGPNTFQLRLSCPAPLRRISGFVAAFIVSA